MSGHGLRVQAQRREERARRREQDRRCQGGGERDIGGDREGMRDAHAVIYDELCQGVVNDRARAEYRRIMRDLADRGAEGILLGCTEIDLLVGPADSPVPVFDTTRLHAERAVELALSPTHANA